MLAVSFFVLVFSSLMWFIFSVRHVMDSLKGVAFFDAGTVSIISYVIIVCLPIFLMWLIFSFVSQYLHNKYINAAMIKLSSQMKRGQEYSDLLSRIMIETEQQIKDGFMLSKFDLLLADMNELLKLFAIVIWLQMNKLNICGIKFKTAENGLSVKLL